MEGKIMKLALILFLLGAMVMPAQAQSWDSALTTGLTEVNASHVGNVWTFVLTNRSAESVPEWDVLVWTSQPFNIPRPIIITCPNGWDWTGTGWEQYRVDPNRKYYTPPAIEENGVFTIVHEDGAAFMNPEDSLFGQPGFACHVGAVVPGSGSSDGSIPWEPAQTIYGGTWFDRSVSIPELPAGALAMIGALGIGLLRRAVRL